MENNVYIIYFCEHHLMYMFGLPSPLPNDFQKAQTPNLYMYAFYTVYIFFQRFTLLFHIYIYIQTTGFLVSALKNIQLETKFAFTVLGTE